MLLLSLRPSEETAVGVQVAQKSRGAPVIAKQSSLRFLYKFSPEAKKKVLEKTKGVEIKDPKEPAPKKTKFVIKPLKSAELEADKEKEAEKEREKEKEKEKNKEKEKEKVGEKPEGDKSKETGAAATIIHEKAQGPKVVHITGLDQPLHEMEKDTTRGKGLEVLKPTEPAPNETTTTAGGASTGVHVRSSAFAAG
ncbi:hypothetical protein Hanom_Chr03g00211321 [Helianthus anomalus]